METALDDAGKVLSEKGVNKPMQNTKESTREYDSDLQMFCEAAREPALANLRFLRWLAERGELEHQVFGPPTGIYAADVRN